MAIVGTVGSGKSSLLSAALGELTKIGGNITIRVSVMGLSDVSFDNTKLLLSAFLQKDTILYKCIYWHISLHRI